MKQIILSIIAALTIFAAKAERADYQTIPLAQSITLTGKADFVIDANTCIEYPSGNAEMKRNAEFLSEYIQQMTGLSLNITTQHDKKAANIILTLQTVTKGNGENNPVRDGSAVSGQYHLDITSKSVILSASTPTGIFYGVQMLRKSLPLGKDISTIELPAAVIEDQPRFGYRGMMLDCCRHFFSIDFVKEYIDLLALHQMNVFHWHLTDDQGWRIEIKKYPRLTEVGAWRNSTVIGCNSDVEDGQRYGGFYTQEQIREIVAYAQERHIEVIPEMDMPGHMLAALAAYPELGCTGGPYTVGTRWGVYRDVLCIGNPATLEFVKNVLDEILPLFPSQYVHIGGDEAPRVRWESCPKCQALIQKEGFAKSESCTAEDLLQSYFTKQVEAYLNSKGKKAICWEESMKGGINPTTTIMAWRGMRGGIAAANAGHDVIMAPLTHCYFDYVQDTLRNYEPQNASIMPIMADKVYTLDVPADLTHEAQQHIIGFQANLWTEYVQCPNWAEYMVLPRMAALAECQWLNAGQKDIESFRQRLQRLMKLYDLYGWNYGKQMIPGRKVDRWNL